MEKPRNLILFLESCKTESTRKSYEFQLEKFLKWSEKDYESLMFLTKPELTDLLVDYTLYLKKRVSPNSLPCYFAGIYKFLDIAEKEYNKTKVNAFFPERVKRGGDRPITDQMLNELVRVSSNEQQRALIYVFSATGCRPQAMADLRVKDVEDIDVDCLTLKVYAGSTHESFICLHSFASDALKKYHSWRKAKGEKLTSDSFVFIAGRKFASMPVQPLTSTAIAKIFADLMEKAKITRVKDAYGRYDLASCGGFRKRFNTIIKRNPDISHSVGEKMMDHKDKLEDYYFKPTREQLFEEYKKAIPELIFDESEKLRIENENKQKKIDELESSKEEISDLQSQIDSLRELMKISQAS